MSYPFLVIFALLPSFIWLLFYLRKDSHPESNLMVLKIFFLGMLSAVPAIFIELGFFRETAGLIASRNIGPEMFFLISFLNVFVGVALTEEVLKYIVVKKGVLNDPEFDEPLDAMLYMIIAALGFVALENLLIFLSPETYFFHFGETLALAAFRFISATLLHALTSGVLGYFMALSFFETKKAGPYLATGFVTATDFTIFL
jgi:RsiW-degrading membrane proteinase PrsW (M82 family)